MLDGPEAGRRTSPGPAAGNNSFRSRAELAVLRKGVTRRVKPGSLDGHANARRLITATTGRRQREIVHASHRDNRVSGPECRDGMSALFHLACRSRMKGKRSPFLVSLSHLCFREILTNRMDLCVRGSSVSGVVRCLLEISAKIV